MALFGFQFYPVCNFGKFTFLGLGTVRSERVNGFAVIKVQVSFDSFLFLATMVIALHDLKTR